MEDCVQTNGVVYCGSCGSKHLGCLDGSNKDLVGIMFHCIEYQKCQGLDGRVPATSSDDCVKGLNARPRDFGGYEIDWTCCKLTQPV